MNNIQYSHEIFTNELDLSTILNEFEFIINVLEEFGVNSVTVFLGFAWVEDFKPFDIEISNLPSFVENLSTKGWGDLSKNDLTIHVNEFNCDIHFCHHTDIHLAYNEHNSLINKIQDHWNSLKIVRE